MALRKRSADEEISVECVFKGWNWHSRGGYRICIINMASKVRAQCLAQVGMLWSLNKGMNIGRLGIGEERRLISCRSEAPVCTSWAVHMTRPQCPAKRSLVDPEGRWCPGNRSLVEPEVMWSQEGLRETKVAQGRICSPFIDVPLLNEHKM